MEQTREILLHQYVCMCRNAGDIDTFEINNYSMILSLGLMKWEEDTPFPTPAYFEQGLVEI